MFEKISIQEVTPKMKRVLHVVSILDRGGMENYIMNIYRHLDRKKIQFDFLVHHKRRGLLEDEIERLGGNIYHATILDDCNIFRYKKYLKSIYAGGQYEIVHGHLGSTAYWYLGEAERSGIPWRILHSHCANHAMSIKGVAKHVMFQFSPIYANVRFACSEKAGKYMFKNQTFEETPNGIDVSHFLYSQAMRREVRNKLGFQDHFVVGHVGRFTSEKNHSFIISIFQKLKEYIPNALLLLVGDGQLKEKVKQKVVALGIEDSVVMTGIQPDCAQFYQAMDVFILPSIYEGLPLAGIEAQCAALPCLFSDNVSTEVRISPLSFFLPIGNRNIDIWINALIKIQSQRTERELQKVDAARFDSVEVAKSMEQRYAMLWRMNT